MTNLDSIFKTRDITLPVKVCLVKTRDLFKKIRDAKGTFHARMGSIKTKMVWT